MIFKIIDENFFKLILNKEFCSNIDIYDLNKIKLLIPDLLKKYIKKFNLKGILKLNIYLDNNYGMIIEIENKKFNFKNNIIELKINFHLNSIFLYKIDDFEIIKLLNLCNQKVYYYKKNYYLELINKIDDRNFNILSELSETIYKNNYNIIMNGIKLYI